MTRLGQVLLVLGISFVVAAGAGVGGADTSGSPDTNTRAVINPGVNCAAQATPAAPCATTSNGATPPSTLSGAAEGTPVSLHVDGQAGMFFGVNAARMCKSGLDVRVNTAMNPSTGNCVGKPFVGTDFQDSSRQDDGFMQVSAAPSNTSVDFTFRVGSGTASWSDSGGSHSLTCDAANPCALWLWESVDTSISPSGNIFKHYDITYSGSSATTTTSPTGATTTTTSPTGATTTTTSPTGATTTTALPGGTTTTTTSPTGATTTTTSPTGATTTTTSPTGATTTTSPTAATTTTAPSGGTTTTTVQSTTTTTSPTGATTTTSPTGATTTTAAPTGATTTTTTPVSGVSVSPASAAPGGTINITSGGWQPCPSSTTSTTSTGSSSCPSVTVTLESNPVTLGTLTPDATGRVTGSFTIPANVPAGSHTIVLTGAGANGQPLTQTVAFTVTAAASGANGSVGSAGGTGSSPSASGTGTSGALAQTGGPLRLFWVGLVMSAVGGTLILLARRRVRLPS